jgi:hypothetical protein
VQLSRLAGGAAALGCSWHHAVGDMHSFMLLMRAWSAFVEGTPPPEVSIVEDPDAYLDKMLPPEDSGRPAFRRPDAAEAAGLRREIEGALRLNRPVQIYFTAAEVDRMRQDFTAAAGRRLSTNDILCGHLASTVRGLDGDTADRRLTLPVNIRGRFDIPGTIVGNLLGELHLPCAGGAAPATIAADLRAAVEDFPRTQLGFRASWAFLEAIGRSRFDECFPAAFDPLTRSFMVTNWARFGVYDIAFGGHRPAFFSPTTALPLPWMCWVVEGFDGEGHLATVILPAALSTRLRGPAGTAALHRFREPGDALPALAGTVRKLV